MGGQASKPKADSSAGSDVVSLLPSVLERMYNFQPLAGDDDAKREPNYALDDVEEEDSKQAGGSTAVAPVPPLRGSSHKNLRHRQEVAVRAERNHAKLAASLAAARPQNVNASTIWESFFSQAFLVGQKAIDSGLIDMDDVLDEEPFLYFGLTGAVVLETILRSLSAQGPAVLVLANGAAVTDATCPPEHKALFEAMCGIKAALIKTGASSDAHRMRQLQRIVLYASSDKPSPRINDEAIRVSLYRVSALVQSVATRISQMEVFLKRFRDVLGLLADAYEDRGEESVSLSAGVHGHTVDDDVVDDPKPEPQSKPVVDEETKVVSAPPPALAPPQAGAAGGAVLSPLSASVADGTEAIWSSLFNSLFDVAQRRIQQGLVSAQDFAEKREYLRVGLAGSTLLEALQRSINAPDGIVLAVGGQVVTEQKCPARLRELFATLLALKQRLSAAALGAEELNDLRRMVLHATNAAQANAHVQAPAAPPDAAGAAAAIGVRPRVGTSEQRGLMFYVASGVTRLAQQIIHMPLYQQNFSSVLELITAVQDV